uniref:Uncharacterized protein n=1 Tax=viral metagenome TaxID=1070528 RepID=A0A6C0AS18_9ZZZZ
MRYLDEDNKFSDESQFQPEIVIQKMKKIKKTKKKKIPNYKNIETLQNIYDEPIDTDDNGNPVIREGLSQNGIADFKDSDYVGGNDHIYEGNDGKPKTFSQHLEDIINYIYNLCNAIPLKIAFYIIVGIEQATYKMKIKEQDLDINNLVNDQKVIARFIGWTICILISMYAIFNWFFVVGYQDENKQGPILPEDYYRSNVANKGTQNSIFKLIDYFFNKSLFFPEYLQEGIKAGSPLLKSTFNPTFIFSFLFFGLIFFLYHSMLFIRNFFIAVVNFDTNNFTLSFMYSVLCILLALSFFDPIISVKMKSVEDVVAFPTKIVAMFSELLSNLNPFRFVLNLVIFILHFLFIVFLGVPFAAFFCCVYLFVYTFFGIILLKWFNFKDIFKLVWEKIPEYARSEKSKIKVETPCDRNTYWQKLVNAFHYAFDFIYKYSFEIAFMYMLLFGLIDSIYKLRMKNVRLTMIIVTVIMMITLLTGTYFHFQYEQEIMEKEAIRNEIKSAKMNTDMDSSSGLGNAMAATTAAATSIATNTSNNNGISTLGYLAENPLSTSMGKMPDLEDLKKKLSGKSNGLRSASSLFF